MIKKNIFLILSLCALLVYVVILQSPLVDQDTGEVPVITFDQSNIEVSVTDQESLLSGVYASDKEDGDLSTQVQIESMSTFISENTRVVTYVVFDSDSNVTKATRTITYVDYIEPTFSLSGQLVSSTYSASSLTSLIHASSCVDGDISSKVAIKNSTLVNNSYVEFYISVSDSTGSTSYLTLNYYLQSSQEIEISLNQYLIYLPLGEVYDYVSNITNVALGVLTDNSLIPYVNIEVPDLSTPGIYEVTYSITRSNGYTGKSILIVVVTDEEGRYE